MWLGTSERMLWVPCPAIDMPRPQERWQASGTFANGGGWVRRSAAGHRVYDLSWNLMPASEISKIRAIFDGVYGQGPFYFIDPSAERTNVFPAAWAQPRLALDGGPPLVYDQVPSREVYPGPNRSYPQVGARYVLTEGSNANTLKIPVPEGYRFHFRAGYKNPYSNQVESARQALLNTIAAYTDAPVQWSTTEPGDTSVVWVDPGSGVARQWSAGVGGSVDDVVTRRNLAIQSQAGDNFPPWSSSGTGAGPLDAVSGSTPIPHVNQFTRQTFTAGVGNFVGTFYRGSGVTGAVGDVVTLSAYIRPSQTSDLRLDCQLRDGSSSLGTVQSEQVQVHAGEWRRFAVTLTADAFYDGFQLWARVADAGTTMQGGDYLDMTAVLAEEGSQGGYFDGDTPDHRTDNIIYRYAWEGEPHESPSTETALGQGWHGITDPDVVAAGQAYADAVAVAEGSTELCYRYNGGDWTPMRSIQHSVTGPGWAEFSLQGTGDVNVFWMQGVVLPAHEPTPTFRDFYPGQGNSGVEIEDFMEHTHSVGIDKYGATVRLREVGSWI